MQKFDKRRIAKWMRQMEAMSVEMEEMLGNAEHSYNEGSPDWQASEDGDRHAVAMGRLSGVSAEAFALHEDLENLMESVRG